MVPKNSHDVSSVGVRDRCRVRVGVGVRARVRVRVRVRRVMVRVRLTRCILTVLSFLSHKAVINSYMLPRGSEACYLYTLACIL